MLTPAEKALKAKLMGNAASFDSFFEHADAPPAPIPMPGQSQLLQSKGNPAFVAQFDTQILVRYFTLTGGAYTLIAPGTLHASLRNKLPVFLFGNADFSSGFAKMQTQYPLSGWSYGAPGIYGKDYFTPYAFDATVTGQLQNGDLIIPFTSALPGTGTTTLGLVIVRCTSIAYGSLLQSITSDRFVMNMIRYVIPDNTKIAQYGQKVGVYYESLFGKFDSDSINPNSYKKPEQLQTNIVDIPLKRGIAKQDTLALYLTYDVDEIDLAFFVYSVEKVTN